MKKAYVKPELQKEEFNVADIIAASSSPGSDTPNQHLLDEAGDGFEKPVNNLHFGV